MNTIFRIIIFVAILVAMPFTIGFAQVVIHDTVKTEVPSYLPLGTDVDGEVFFLSSAIFDSSLRPSVMYAYEAWGHTRKDSRGCILLNVCGSQCEFIGNISPYFYPLYGSAADSTSDAHIFTVRLTTSSYAIARVEKFWTRDGEIAPQHTRLIIEVPEKDKAKFESLFDKQDAMVAN